MRLLRPSTYTEDGTDGSEELRIAVGIAFGTPLEEVAAGRRKDDAAVVAATLNDCHFLSPRNERRAT